MYEPVTAYVFKKKLRNNEYAGATGARRALGKLHLPLSTKATLAKAIDRKFGKGK